MKKTKKACAVYSQCCPVSLLASASQRAQQTKVKTSRRGLRPAGLILTSVTCRCGGVRSNKWSVWPCRRRGECFVSSRATASTPSRTSVEKSAKQAVAYPNEEFNTLNTAAPRRIFFPRERVRDSSTVWVLDVGQPSARARLISGGAKARGHRPDDQRGQRTIVSRTVGHEGHIHHDVRV